MLGGKVFFVTKVNVNKYIIIHLCNIYIIDDVCIEYAAEVYKLMLHLQSNFISCYVMFKEYIAHISYISKTRCGMGKGGGGFLREMGVAVTYQR